MKSYSYDLARAGPEGAQCTRVNPTQAFPYELSGISSLIGRVIDIHEWAERARIPNRKAPGFLDGQAVERPHVGDACDGPGE